MPASTFDDSLVDSLVVDVIDELRSDLYPSMGITAYNVYLVRRRWSGSRRGQGSPTITSDVLMDPPPLVTFANNQQALHFEASPIGRQEEGDVRLTEVSLTFTEAELTGGVIAPTDEFYYRLVDAHGQQIKPRYYVISSPPQPDRMMNMGWVVDLRRADTIIE